MILLDMNQLVISNMFQLDNKIDIDLLRHLVLNTIRMYRTKFHKKHGEIVICHDSTNNWRKDVFPEYKKPRRERQKKSDVDWCSFYDIMSILKEEMKTNLPYKCIEIDRAEADDVIAVLCKQYGREEPTIIVSSDKDFKQLQMYSGVEQYSPMKRDYLVCENPKRFLEEHIMSGDTSDGIPNILSDSDTFVVEGKRQKRLTSNRKTQVREAIVSGEVETLYPNWERNKITIDLSCVPDIISEKVIEEFENQSCIDRKTLLDYFIDKRLSNLIPHIEEF